MKLVLGTAQFGLDYGITNTRGKVARQEVYHILKKAKSYGVTTLDTAIAYGDSEQVLGECCAEIKGFEFISKVIIRPDSVFSVTTEVEKSCDRLNINSLYALMVHNVDALLENDDNGFWHEMENLKQKDRVKKIGISVYSPDQAKKIIERYDIDIIQIPFNLLDQRFKHSGLLKEFKLKNIEVHARSVFLQGLLLSDFSSISNYFDDAKMSLNLIEDFCMQNQLSKLSLALHFLMGVREIDSVVFGVTSLGELEEVVDVFNCYAGDLSGLKLERLHIDNERIINPIFWPTKENLTGVAVEN